MNVEDESFGWKRFIRDRSIPLYLFMLLIAAVRVVMAYVPQCLCVVLDKMDVNTAL